MKASRARTPHVQPPLLLLPRCLRFTLLNSLSASLSLSLLPWHSLTDFPRFSVHFCSADFNFLMQKGQQNNRRTVVPSVAGGARGGRQGEHELAAAKYSCCYCCCFGAPCSAPCSVFECCICPSLGSVFCSARFEADLNGEYDSLEST